MDERVQTSPVETHRSSSPDRSSRRALRSLATLAFVLSVAVALPAQESISAGAEQLVAAAGDRSSVVMDGDGRGVVVWVHETSSEGPAIRARRFADAPLPALAAPFWVSPAPTSMAVPAIDPRVAMDARGGFAVVWSASEVHGRLFRSDGRPRGGELVLSPRDVLALHPEIAMAPDGRFAVAWEQSHWDPTRAVRLGTFTASGRRLARPLIMAANGTSANLVGAVSASPSSVAVGWTEFTPCPSNPIDPVSAVATFSWSLATVRGVDRLANDNPCVDGPQVLALPGSELGPLGIFVGRRYSIQRFSPADGERVGARTNVAELPPCGFVCERVVAVAGDHRGRFVFIWERYASGFFDLFAELYGREGRLRVGRFQVNGASSAANEHPSATLTSDGRLIVTWTRAGEGILMRRFTVE